VFKAKVALVALLENKTLAELVRQFDVHRNKITEWKRALCEATADVFDGKSGPREAPVDLKALQLLGGPFKFVKFFRYKLKLK
jgi:transposase